MSSVIDIKISRQKLLDLITPLSPAVTRATGGHFTLTIGGGVASVSATSETMAISLTDVADGELACCPEYATFKAALSGLSSDDVSLTLDGGRLTVSGKGKRIVRCVRYGSLPSLPELTGDVFTVDGAELKRAITFVKSAASDEALAKTMLCGVHLNGNDVVATDASILRLQRIADALPKCTVPSGSIGTLLKMLPDGPVDIRVGSRISVSLENGEFSSALIAQPFPESYPRIIPAAEGAELVAMADALARSTAAVSGFADDKDRSAFLSLSKDSAVLHCDSASEPLEIASYSGEERKFLLNTSLLVDMLSAFGKEAVRIWLPEQPQSPIRFEDSDGRVGVLMPMRY